MVVCLIFEKVLKLCFSFLFIYPLCVIYYIYCRYIFSDKWYANGIVFNICNMKFLFEWFIQSFVLFHCSCGNKE